MLLFGDVFGDAIDLSNDLRFNRRLEIRCLELLTFEDFFLQMVLLIVKSMKVGRVDKLGSFLHCLVFLFV